MYWEQDEKVEYALSHTQLVRPPEQRLSTFGSTNIHYYLLTEPLDSVGETRIREGKVIAERPRIVTPGYFLNTFEGFGEHAKEQAMAILNRYGYEPDILEYRYKNRVDDTWVISEHISQVISKISEKIDNEKDTLAAILKGPDDAWQISLMKFVLDLTRASLPRNIFELDRRGLFERIQGIPRFVRDEIEQLFREVEDGRVKIDELGSKLQSYGLFEKYQDRFFALLRRKRRYA